MALADYSTSVEKIAALKAAMIDPSIVTLLSNNATLNTTETIYITYSPVPTVDAISLYSSHPNNYIIVDTGHAVKGSSATTPVIYIKDSDITYSDPITTYQDRLSYILSTPQTFTSSTFTIGTYGSLFFIAYQLKINKGGDLNFVSDVPGCIPIPFGENISSLTGASYINVPSDW